jgi:DNA-binding transcriptional LysR family regulator
MVTDEVRNGLADFGIGYVDDVPRSFVTEDLGIETFHLVMRRDHVLARRTRIGLPALADVPLVSFPAESRTRHVVDRAATTAGLSFRYVTTTNRLPTLHGLVRNRVGLAVVPKSERPSPDDPFLTSLSLVGQGLTCRVGIMRLRDRELSAAAAQFLDVVHHGLLGVPLGLEGVALAEKGIASLHVQGRFPWVNSTKGADADG